MTVDLNEAELVKLLMLLTENMIAVQFKDPHAPIETPFEVALHKKLHDAREALLQSTRCVLRSITATALRAEMCFVTQLPASPATL
jgi:hypothetical protein